MGVDQRILTFSKEVFRLLWFRLDFKNCDDVVLTSLNDSVAHAVLCRRLFFKSMLKAKLEDYVEYFKDLEMHFFLCLKDNMTSFIPFENLNVFDKLLMTIAVVVEMSILRHRPGKEEFYKDAPNSWALYFDIEFNREFYDNGGFNELESYCKLYHSALLHNYHLSKVQTMTLTDVEYIHKWFLAADYIYDIENITSTFYELLSLEGRKVCPRCQPCCYALTYCRCKTCPAVDNYQLIEGFLQLILKTQSMEELSKKMGINLFSVIGSDLELSPKVCGTEISRKQSAQELDKHFATFKAENTGILKERLFSKAVEKDPSICVFCGKKLDSLHGAKRSASTSLDKINKINIAFYYAIQEYRLHGFDEISRLAIGVDGPWLLFMRSKFSTLSFLTEEHKKKLLDRMTKEREPIIQAIQAELDELEELVELEELNIPEQKRKKNKSKKKKSR